jgi:HD-like signal output (HDOD) protein
MEDALEGCGTADVSLERALADLVSRKTVRVPPYPATALRLAAVLSQDDYTTQHLVDAMRGDPVFTGNLLRLANSAFYRRGGEVTSLPVAVQRLGARELTRLAMASTVAKLSTGEGPLQPLRRRAWREALAAAVVCETVCRLETGDGGEGFVAALLHDTGKLLVLGAIDEVWQDAPSLADRDEAAWASLLDRFHVPFGELLAQRWSLPGVLGAVISTHHDAPGSLGPLTRAVVQADAVVALLERHVEVRAADLEALGLDPRAADAVARVIPSIPATLRAFDPTGPVSASAAPTPPHARQGSLRRRPGR